VLAPWLFLPLPLAGRLALLAAVFVLGGLAATRAEAHFGRCDPGAVIIDEVVGQWVTLLPFAYSPEPAAPTVLALAFGLFRLFDIWKPWPVRWCETCLPQGFGIMIDDVAAGLYAMIGLMLVRIVFGIA
jgi:phosphatidylglycerophosphatase A